MFPMIPPERVKHGSGAHFTFGNECPMKNSTYQLDFGNICTDAYYESGKKHRPPTPAQVSWSSMYHWSVGHLCRLAQSVVVDRIVYLTLVFGLQEGS